MGPTPPGSPATWRRSDVATGWLTGSAAGPAAGSYPLADRSRSAALTGPIVHPSASLLLIQKEQNARQPNPFRRRQALALQLRSVPGSDSLGHHDSEVMDDGRVGGGGAGAVGLVVAGCEGPDAALVPAGSNGSLGRALFGCSARA